MSDITEKRLGSLKKRYKELYPDMKINWVNFANWMNSAVRPNIIPSSWQAYSHAFKSVCPLSDALDIIKNTKSPPRSQITARGSRLRKKSLQPKDMTLLTNFSKVHHNSRWAEISITWLACGILTGLRPHEWMYACLDNDLNLTVDNIKLNQTTLSTWSPRVIPLSHLETEELSMIKLWIAKMKAIRVICDEDKDAYTKFIKGCQQWLYITNKRIWPRRKQYICLLSARHQFIANLKANRFTPVEIAYLVGHANDLRSYESYGATRFGTKGISLPDTTEINQEDFDKIALKLDDAVRDKIPNIPVDAS